MDEDLQTPQRIGNYRITGELGRGAMGVVLLAPLCPVIGFIVGLTCVKGPCPYCGQEISGFKMSGGITCGACKKRAVIDKTQDLLYTPED